MATLLPTQVSFFLKKSIFFVIVYCYLIPFFSKLTCSGRENVKITICDFLTERLDTSEKLESCQMALQAGSTEKVITQS